MYNKILSFLDKSQKIKTIELIFLMLLSSVVELINVSLVLLLLNFFLETQSQTSSFLPFDLFSKFTNIDINTDIAFFWILASFGIIFVLKLLILLFVAFKEAKFIANFKEKLSNKIFYNFLHREPEQLLKKNSSEYLRNFTTEIDRTTIFFHSILKVILESIIIIILFIFLIFYDFLSALTISLILLTFSIFYFSVIKNFLYKWSKKSLFSKLKIIQFINESFSGIKYIKILSRESSFYDKFRIRNSELAKILFKNSFINSIPRHLLEFLLFISILCILFILFRINYSYEDIIKVISVYLAISIRLIPSASRILTSVQNIKFNYLSFEKILNEKNIKIVKSNQRVKNLRIKKNLVINIKNFFYNKKNNFSLKNINIKINKNQIVGIIGPSGSGKSTIINMICGFTKPNKGGVFVDNTSIFENYDSWKKNIGFIPQNIVILNDTIRENILFGSKNNQLTDRKLIEIIKKVNLYNFYKKQKKGLNAIIKEEGLNISGGEIQRIGIARALIENPELIICDEATSALDTFTENQILKEIKSLNKTTIIVSHRMNTLRYCNQIYGIKKGQVKKYGNYVQLNKKFKF